MNAGNADFAELISVRARKAGMDVQIFTTGGTIDKVYFDARSDYAVGDPQIVDILQTAAAGFSYRSEVLTQKDSLDLTEEDREHIVHQVASSSSKRVILTHGTDTMVETAKAVSERLGETPNKTVVLVGSLTPARFKSSDAEFNIGFAAAAVQLLPPGVHIAMNGQIFDPCNVRKNRDENRFEVV